MKLNDQKDDDDDGGAAPDIDQRDIGKAIADAYQNNPDMLHDDFKNKTLVGKLKELRDAILAVYERRLRNAYTLLKEGPKKNKTLNNTPRLKK